MKKWLILTCDATAKIVPVQQYLFQKYLPDVVPFVEYINLGNMPVSTWTNNVLNKISHVNDDLVIFGLDDFLPINRIDMDRYVSTIQLVQSNPSIQRYEMGYGAYHDKKNKYQFIQEDGYLRYATGTPYSASTQFSIWKLKDLRKALTPVKSPWRFETNTVLDHAACGQTPIFRWIEESGLSGRQKGKINLYGMRQDDVRELIDMKLVPASEIIYGWSGSPVLPSSHGSKYLEFYQ